MLVLAAPLACADRAPTSSAPPVAPSAAPAQAADSTHAVDADEDILPSGAYTVDKPSLDAPDVVVFSGRAEGTTHFADRVRVRDRSGAELLLETPDDALETGAPLAPLLEIARRASNGRVMLLGWSSRGGGMQTYHALVVTNVAPRIAGELAWTDSRGGPGIAVAGDRIGIPEPSSAESELVVGGGRMDQDALARLAYAPPPPEASFYAAPVHHDDARSRAARYTWFEIADAGALPR